MGSTQKLPALECSKHWVDACMGWVWMDVKKEMGFFMYGHGKQILKGNQGRKLASLCPPPLPTCSRYGKRHMISQWGEKGTSADITCIS